MYTLQWDVVRRPPLLGSDPMPDTYNPSNRESLKHALAMRARSGIANAIE